MKHASEVTRRKCLTPNLLRGGALALLTTLAVLVPSAAMAGSYVRPDTSGDVVKYATWSSTTGTKVPDRPEGDILSSSVVNGKRRVTMAMRADGLSQVANGATFYFRIGTPHKVRRLYIDTYPGAWRGVKAFRKDVKQGKQVKCHGIRWSVDYGANLVRASVPQRCLGRPKWVRVGMALVTYDGGQAKPVYIDDAATNGSLGSVPRWGPRVFRA